MPLLHGLLDMLLTVGEEKGRLPGRSWTRELPGPGTEGTLTVLTTQMEEHEAVMDHRVTTTDGTRS